MRTILIILILLTASQTYQIMTYQAWIPKLVWSVDTLWINYQAQREAALKCKIVKM